MSHDPSAPAGHLPSCDEGRGLLTGALAGLLALAALTGAARAESALTLGLTDATGRTLPATAILFDQGGDEVARAAAPGEPVSAKPGKYRLSAQEATGLGVAVELADGPSAKSIPVADSVWLKLSMPTGHAPMRVLVHLKPAAQLRGLLPRVHLSMLNDQTVAYPRLEASAETRRAALALARAELAKSDPAGSDERKRRHSALRSAVRILDVVGEGDDAELLLKARTDQLWMADLVFAAARIEARLGTIADGRVAKAAAERTPLGDVAAAALRGLGLDLGDAALIAQAVVGKLDPRLYPELMHAGNASAARPAMLAALQRYLELQARIDAEKKGASNDLYPAVVPALLFLLAHQPDAELGRALDALVIDSWQIQAMAVAADQPATLVAPMLAQRGFVTAANKQSFENSAFFGAAPGLGALCQAATTLTPAGAEQLYQTIDRTLAAAIPPRLEQVAKGDWMYARDFVPNVRGVFATHWAACRPSRWAAAAYQAHNCGSEQCVYWHAMPYTDWLPQYWRDAEIVGLLTRDTGGLWNDAVAAQVDQMTPARLDELLPKPRAWPIDLLAAAHAVAATGPGRFPSLVVTVGSDTVHLPYMLGRQNQKDTNYDGYITGVLRLTPRLVGTRLQLRLSLAQEIVYAKHNMYDGGYPNGPPLAGAQRYIVERGRALIAGVTLRRGEAPIEVSSRGLADDGTLLYEAEVGSSGLSGLQLAVALDNYGDRRVFGLTLATSDYAARLRRAEALLERVRAAGPKSDAALLARVLSAGPHVDEAGTAWERALAADPQNAALWSEAADFHAGVGDQAGALALLQRAHTALPEQRGLAIMLASKLYVTGAYGDAAKAFGELAMPATSGPEYAYLYGLASLLAGDVPSAVTVLGRLPVEFQPAAVARLRLIAARAAGPEAVKTAREGLAKLAAAHKGQPDEAQLAMLGGSGPPAAALDAITVRAPTPAIQCEGRFWIGEHLLLDGKPEEARPHLQIASEICTRTVPEWHLAKMALATLPAGR